MDKNIRVYMYAFLSKVFEKEVDTEFIKELKNDDEFLNVLLGDDKEWFTCKDENELIDELNVDFSTVFLMHNPPYETVVLEERDEF